MNMTIILLTVSVGCNLWFLFLLLYDRIMDTKIVRFFRNLAGLWRALDCKVAKQETTTETPPEEVQDIIGKSRFKMASTRTTAAIPVPQTATLEKGIELSEEDATFDDGNAKPPHARHKSRKTNLMKPSQAFRLRNWSTGRMNRKRVNRIRHGLRAAVLTRLTMRSGQPRTRKRQRKNVRKRQRFSPIWKERNCTTN